MGINFPANPTEGTTLQAEGADFIFTGGLWCVLAGDNLNFANQAMAEAGTRTDRVMSPLRTEQAIAARGFVQSEGYGTPVNVAAQRAEAVTYTNNTGRNLFWMFEGANDVTCIMRVAPTGTMVDFTTARLLTATGRNGVCGFLVVPPTWRYRVNGSGVTISRWWEW